MARAETVGTHPEFIRMIRALICERLLSFAEPSAQLGTLVFMRLN